MPFVQPTMTYVLVQDGTKAVHMSVNLTRKETVSLERTCRCDSIVSCIEFMTES